ncbi:ABC transporter ATP-binding protein [Anaerococcus degeneri]|uniref:ABC transporter ATP-binding protein/permease n=1 Tax=Anaerococcus degeneri TaxID=361500 RepID=A0ABS7YYZ3_9FIRM|nr:ABC transporter ATP-binding protein [Anaerococcus degeneri]MBP2015312.1 ABC-type multidrug transport system fused ATPase/permease subunit [Anaerococcus degeneri]MCA2096208.1 ABC transporter ATP-binding protein/permease [Anaerococcus degeneri]
MLRFFYLTDKKEFIKLLIIRLIVIGLGLLIPINTAKAIDFSILKDLDMTIKHIVIMVLLDIGIHIFYVLEDYYFGKNDAKAYLKQFEKLDLALKTYDSKVYNIDQARINQELGQNFEIVQPFIYKNTLRIFLNALKFVAICIIVFFISPYLLIAFVIIAPIAALVSYKREEKISDYSSNHLDDMKNVKGYLLDTNNLSKEERFLRDKQLPPIRDFFNRFFTNLIKKVRYESLIYNIFVYGTLNIAITLTTIISIILIIKGKMTPGSYAAVSIYISSLWDPMLDTFNTRREYVSGKPAMDSFYEFINMTPVSFDKAKIKSLEIKDYISLGSKGERLHQAFNQEIKQGKINLIVGDNGIGKTTLVEAIMNLTTRYEGKIFVNNKLVDKNSKVLFEDLVYIPANPLISEYGVLKDKIKASSGQKKLAQLKYAIKTDKSLYIFDEPTNFLDKEVKGKVLDLIMDLNRKGKLVIVISHDEIFMKNSNFNLIRINK